MKHSQFSILVANSGISGESDPARRNSLENGIGESGRSGQAGQAVSEQGHNAKIRVIRRSSRRKNKPRQANKEDNEILEDSGEDDRPQAHNAGGPSKLVLSANLWWKIIEILDGPRRYSLPPPDTHLACKEANHK